MMRGTWVSQKETHFSECLLLFGGFISFLGSASFLYICTLDVSEVLPDGGDK